MNLKTKHKKPRTREQSGEIVQMEAQIHMSNLVMVEGAEKKEAVVA